MIEARNFLFGRVAFRGQMILVGQSTGYAYKDGMRTDTVSHIRATVVLPDMNYGRLEVKLPVGTEIDEQLIGKPVDFADFHMRVYGRDRGGAGLSCTATSIRASKG